MTDAIGYVRVSTEEQADSRLGLEAQRAAIVAEAERRGWRLVEIVEDAAVSGRDLHRPGMELVLRARQARRVDRLVVAKLDRVGRSLLDVAGRIDQAARQGWALVALDVGVDTGRLTGKAMAGMMAVFAELERGLIGQRTRDALRAARVPG
jgi:DNA invertase Pin-like site-specific DNA recombinase